MAIGCHATREDNATWTTWSSADSTLRVDSAAGEVARQGTTSPSNTSAATNATNPAMPARVLPPRAEPELPRSYVDTRYVAPSGRRHIVRRGDNLQSTLDAAQPGDVILLEPGAT